MIAISQSGETIDVLQAIRKLKGEGGRIASITNVIESAIARESEYKIYMRAGPEIGVAATKTFTAQLVSLLVIYSVFNKGKLKEVRKSR